MSNHEHEIDLFEFAELAQNAAAKEAQTADAEPEKAVCNTFNRNAMEQAALAFLLQFANRKTNPYGVSALLLWAGFSALRIYFDMRYLLMSPRRVLHLVALVALLVFAIGELRLARKIAAPRLYVLTAAPAMVLMGTDAITNLLLTAMGWITLGAEISTYCVLLAASVYAFARLYALVTPAKQSSAPVIVASDVSPEDKNSPDTENNSPEESEEVPQ